MDVTRVSVHLTLCGEDFDIDYVSNVLDISPKYIRKKDEMLGNGRIFGHTEWGIFTELEVSNDVNVQMEKIINPLLEKVDLLNNVRIECSAEWNIVIVVYIENGDTPAMGFSRKELKFFVDIGAQVGFDVYVMSERR